MSWRILPGARDDILGTAGSVLTVLPLYRGVLCPVPRSAGAWDRDLAHASRKAETRTCTPYPTHSSPCRLGNGALFDLITHAPSLISLPPAPSSSHRTTCTAQQSVIWGPRAPISGCSCVTWDGNDDSAPFFIPFRDQSTSPAVIGAISSHLGGPTGCGHLSSGTEARSKRLPKRLTMAHNGRLLWVFLPQLYLLTGAAIVSGSWRQNQKLENILKMALSGKVIESPRKLNLRPLGVESDTERGDRFWNRNVVEMKFSVEHDWMKRVCFAESIWRMSALLQCSPKFTKCF